MRIGMGYDVHRLVSGRKLVLGGVTIPFEKGLLGHSDADVLVHAICDALLGAAGLGDIGLHFPDTDPKYKDISSLKLLFETAGLVLANGYQLQNIDTTIFAESPRLAPYRTAMQLNIAQTLKVDACLVNIKATTVEGLGIIGSGEGIAAMSVVLLD
ncbi:MAG: 2-C-methyl-D-erythritol 2,4-cyclodiphosphate synthase [Desulfobacterales bacterium]|nr:2-C-methyl-D-erythritol 2,4-cyclodiphosphate synthase [Desulfobacterales bacterium]